MVYTIGDGYEYSAEIAKPIEYTSIDDFLINFEFDLLNYIEGKPTKMNFNFSDFVFYLDDSHVKFYKQYDLIVMKNSCGRHVSYTLPEVYTLDEWFEENKFDIVEIST